MTVSRLRTPSLLLCAPLLLMATPASDGHPLLLMATPTRFLLHAERFKGYRKNKVVHLMHMEQAGMTFVATPRAWVVHVAHPQADTWAATQQSGYWNKLKRLYAIAREEMEADAFVPATSFRCLSRKPEQWSWYRRRRLLRRGAGAAAR